MPLPDYLQHAIRAGYARALCPACRGGRSREESLSIRRDGPLISLYCFRGTCGWRSRTITDAAPATPAPKGPRPYADELLPIDKHSDLADVLSIRYELDWRVYGRRWSETATGALAMSVLGPHGQSRGHMTRTLTRPKRCMSYQIARPWLDWWGLDSPDAYGRGLFMVEDQISACKIAGLGYVSVALMGTGLTFAGVQEIAQVCDARRLTPVLALDPDATTKAFSLQRRYAHALPGLRVLPMQRDPKDTSEDALRGMLW